MKKRSPLVVEQIPLRLNASEPFASDYFVPHSGVGQSLSQLLDLLERFQQEKGLFQTIYLHGASGTGKSHLIQIFQRRAEELGLDSDAIFLRDFQDETRNQDSEVAPLVSEYENRKTLGGVFFVASRLSLEQFSSNPHLLSRLKSGMILELRSPSIEEMRPTLISLLERRNLKLSERAIEYIVRRVPTNPLCLWAILAKMDDRALREGRTVGLYLIREILGEL